MQILHKNMVQMFLLRNSDLSSDTASTWDAMKYVLKQYEKLGEKYDTITVLQPTSPLRDAGDIKTAFAFLKIRMRI